MTDSPNDRIVISYMGDDHYHREDPGQAQKPACNPQRIRGVPAIRTEAERRGQTPCSRCWPPND